MDFGQHASATILDHSGGVLDIPNMFSCGSGVDWYVPREIL